MSENRVSRRVNIKAALSLRVGDGPAVHGWIQDISITGVHINTDESIPIGTKCQVCLIIREGTQRRRLHLDARVMRQDAKGMGLQFLPMDPDVHIQLSDLLLSNMTVATPN